MKLQRFAYFFSVTGHSGGLYSMQLEFLPIPGSTSAQGDPLKVDFQRIEALLEQLLHEMDATPFRKIPRFTDSPHSTSVGYQYELPRKAMRAASGIPLLRALFARLPGQLEPESMLGGTCEISGVQEKRTGEASIELEVRLGHRLNRAVFETLLALPELAVSEEADREVARLRTVLEAHARGAEDLHKLLGKDGGSNA